MDRYKLAQAHRQPLRVPSVQAERESCHQAETLAEVVYGIRAKRLVENQAGLRGLALAAPEASRGVAGRRVTQQGSRE